MGKLLAFCAFTNTSSARIAAYALTITSLSHSCFQKAQKTYLRLKAEALLGSEQATPTARLPIPLL
jgi:hypothetical protein